MEKTEKELLRDALKAFRRIKATTSETEDFKPTTEGSIRRIAAEQIIRLETAGIK